MSWLQTARTLRRNGVVGINERNCDYVFRLNRRHLYPLVDDKLRTKRLALEAGIAVPQLIGVVRIHHEAETLGDLLAGYDDFVMKPSHGSGGNGILVVVSRYGDRFRKSGGEIIDLQDLQHHSSEIIGGAYSLGGRADSAMIEQRVVFDPVFEKVSYQGVPDVRIIVALGVPVMAMVRLPTRASDGRANLHQGAIGAGIDLDSGCTTNAVCRDRAIEEHPDTGEPVRGIEVPHWPRLLDLAARCHELTGLGYLGVDLVLDRDQGPLMLELNARPGLAIQIANGRGLRHRLDAVERALPRLSTVEARVSFARASFGGGRG